MSQIVTKDQLLVEAKAFIANLSASPDRATIIFLRGNLGAGKTTFSQFIGQTLGIKENIISPTYVILKKYNLPTGQKWQTLVHLDLYRLNEEREIELLGLNSLANDPSNLLLIEWPDQITGWEVKPDAIINLDFKNEAERVIDINYGQK